MRDSVVPDRAARVGLEDTLARFEADLVQQLRSLLQRRLGDPPPTHLSERHRPAEGQARRLTGFPPHGQAIGVRGSERGGKRGGDWVGESHGDRGGESEADREGEAGRRLVDRRQAGGQTRRLVDRQGDREGEAGRLMGRNGDREGEAGRLVGRQGDQAEDTFVPTPTELALHREKERASLGLRERHRESEAERRRGDQEGWQGGAEREADAEAQFDQYAAGGLGEGGSGPALASLCPLWALGGAPSSSWPPFLQPSP